MKCRTVYIFLGLIIILLVGGSFFGLEQKSRHLEAEAKMFCESFIVKLEEAKKSTGKFPAKLDSAWLQGKRIPILIDSTNFYAGFDTEYDFHFRNRWNFFDTLFSYNSTLKTWLVGD